jgi:hypothetical protein
MKIEQILEQMPLSDRDIPQYNESDIIDAITSDNPEVNLKKVFPRDFLPKVMRWLEDKLKDVKVGKDAKNIVGGELRVKLDKYLEAEEGEDTYEDNAEMLVRELLNSIDKWNEYETKPKDLPDVGLPG